jgi:hypothetical protein
MNSRKILGIAFVAVLFVFAFWGMLLAWQGPSAAEGEVIRAKGCLEQGVEAGCLIVKTFDGKHTYNVLFGNGKKPDVGAAISFEGVEHQGPTICMQGTAVVVKKWSRIKKHCPPEPAKQ